MTKPNSIEFEFDLLALDGENAIENFKTLFGKKLKELGLNYEIFNLSDPKMTGGGGSIDSGSSNTYPYNMFENFMDTVFKKKHDIKAESSNIYDMLFRDFKGHVEEDYTKKLIDITSAENGNFIDTADQSKKILEETLPTDEDINAQSAEVNPTLAPAPVYLNNSSNEGIFSSIQKSISDLSDPIKLSVPSEVAQEKKAPEIVSNNDEDIESDVDSEVGVKKNKIITLKLIIQYTDVLSLEGIKKG
uniref:Uncharacterized protein n=1 Tax=viral metagenome TaxID=1070528 RepID=A0A6C0B2L6_9ZZZZ